MHTWQTPTPHGTKRTTHSLARTPNPVSRQPTEHPLPCPCANPSSVAMFGLVVASLLIQYSVAFRSIPVPASSSASRLYYNYFKKDGEKREIGRLWKNIIFPGIYQEYQDTVEPKKTIKIKSEAPKRSAASLARSGTDSFFSQDSKSGTYK